MDKIDINSIILLVIAVINAITFYYSKKAKEVVLETANNIKLLEINTNSIKDALIKTTGDAAHAAGKEEARLEGEAKAAILAEGIIEGKKV